MEDNKQNYTTFNDLAKFAEDILLPAMQDMFDENNKRLDSMDKRFDKMDERFDKIDERLDTMDSKIERNSSDIFKLQESVDKINDKLDNLVKTEEEDVIGVGMDVGQLKHGFKNHELRISALENG